MEEICKNGAVAIRKMRDVLADYARMARWLSDPDVLTYYHGRDNPFDLDKTMAHYAPRVRGEEGVMPCIIAYEGKPIGYLQYYRDDDENTLLSVPAVAQSLGGQTYQNPYGIDLFIGESDSRNKGIGTAALRLFVRHLLQSGMADIVLIDPQTWNTRAIRCYEKCGFKALAVLPKREWHEGEHRDNLVMAITAASSACP